MIIFPMAGRSRRFTEAGYDVPKYMLPLGGLTAFDHAVGGFRRYFASEPFLFVARAVEGLDVAGFVRARVLELGIADPRLVVLPRDTAGQAETVEHGLDSAEVPGQEPITIFNIDTFRPGFTRAAVAARPGSSGYLEVFRGEGANWSYVRPAPGEADLVAETAEKRPISDLCCTGLYHFSASGEFRAALAAERAAPSAPELYVAPIFNHLIRAGRLIHFQKIARSEVIFCGTPAEYEELRAEPREFGGARPVSSRS